MIHGRVRLIDLAESEGLLVLLPRLLESLKELFGLVNLCPFVRSRMQPAATANPRTKILDFRGFDYSRILNLRDGTPMSIGKFPEMLCRQIFLVGIVLVGRSGVALLLRGWSALGSREWVLAKHAARGFIKASPVWRTLRLNLVKTCEILADKMSVRPISILRFSKLRFVNSNISRNFPYGSRNAI